MVISVYIVLFYFSSISLSNGDRFCPRICSCMIGNSVYCSDSKLLSIPEHIGLKADKLLVWCYT